MAAAAHEPLQIGEWLVDPRDDSLTRGSERAKIEPRTMRLLVRLAQTPGLVVSQDELLESVWSGVVVGTASVYQSMSQLRKVLGDTDDPPRYIETVARKGYRLLAPVSAPKANGHSDAFAVMPAAGPPATAEPAPAARSRKLGWIAIALVATIAIVAAVWRFMPGAVPAGNASIVVLPFVDLTDGQTEQVFCDGLTEETSNWLAQVPTLHVVARTSAFSYRNRNTDVRTIGRELNTSHVLEGSLRRSGNTMRIAVQLIDTSNGFHVWSHAYTVEAGNVLQVQEQIAREVVGNLELRMTTDIEASFAGRHAGNAEAQRLYLIAKANAARLEGPSNEQAILLYQQAIAADPEFALAKVWLAHSISRRRYFSNVQIESLASQFEPLLADVARTAPQLVDLYLVRGLIRVQMRQREAAMQDLRRALDMSPNSRDAAAALAYYYMTNGEPRDALTYYTVAVGLDPRAFGLHAYSCIVLWQLSQFPAAEAACARARTLEPESPLPFSISSSMEAARGNFVEALKWSDAALEHGSDIAETHSDRGQWLLSLGLLDDAGHVYDEALRTNAENANQNAGLILVGSTAAIERGGQKGFEAFIRASGAAESDNPSILFELANAALMVGDGKSASAFVTRALASDRLAEEDLTSPYNAAYGQSYLLIAAAALRDAGDEAGATRRLDQLGAVLQRLDQAGMQTYGTYSLKAQLAAMRGQPDAAMTALQRAAQLGWGEVWLAEHQPYFESLRKREDFRELLAAARARNAATAVSIRSRLATSPAPKA